MARRKYQTLSANTVATVTVVGKGRLRVACLKNPADIYYTTDGSAPTLQGDDCFCCPAGGVSEESAGSWATTGLVVKLISSGTPDTAVQLFDPIQGGS